KHKDGAVENKLHCDLLLEKGDETLRDFLVRTSPNKELALSMIRQLCLGADFIHRHNWIHGDLCSSNVLLFTQSFESLTVKLADFSLVKKVGKPKFFFDITTAPWRAPEVILKTRYKRGPGEYTTAMDVWSLGVLMFEIVFGRLPFM